MDPGSAQTDQWVEQVHWYAGDRPKGRAGKGASNHCAHGKSTSTEVSLDWRPFEYSTAVSFENGKKTFSETFRFEPLPGGRTRVQDIMQVHIPLPRFQRRILAHIVLVYNMKYDPLLAKAARLAEEEYKSNMAADKPKGYLRGLSNLCTSSLEIQ